MTPSTISQPLNNVVAQPQNGDGVVAGATVDFSGGDALLSFSGSAWSSQPGQVSLQLWVDGQPAGEPLWMYANTGEMHLALGRSFVSLPGMSAGSHEITVVAGPTTITDQNDYVCVTLWELGDGLAARAVYDGQGPQGGAEGGTFVKERYETAGGTFCLLSSSGSGWVGASGIVQTAAQVVNANPLTAVGEVYANNANQHLATVPTDRTIPDVTRGEHLLTQTSGQSTWIDQGDYGHVSVLEFLDNPDSPIPVDTNPPLQNAVAQPQQGDGGVVATTSFTSNGGTLLFRLNASAWTNGVGVPISVGAMIDGGSGSVGVLVVYANFAQTHMTLVSNDLVVPGIAAGNHTLTLIGEANTITDQNDRVSVTILEFPAG